jgi:large subunit ribosomal protein L17
MRHYKKGRKLGTSASHSAAIKRNLCVNLLANDRIKTTLERAKEIRGDVDRLITWAKRGDVHSRRLAIAKLGDKELVRELFSKVEQGLFKDRPGGYTRIFKVGRRRGDAAVIVIMELVQEPFKPKVKAQDADKAAAGKGAADKTKPKRTAAKKDGLKVVAGADTEDKDKDDVTDQALDSADKDVDVADESGAVADDAAEATDKNADGSADSADEDVAEDKADAPADDVAATENTVASEQADAVADKDATV